MPRIETEPDCGDVVYPESDGKPMADNLTQGCVIRKLVMGFDCLFADQPDVLVGGDFFWYPVEGDPKVVVAPDTTRSMVLSRCTCAMATSSGRWSTPVPVTSARSPVCGCVSREPNWW